MCVDSHINLRVVFVVVTTFYTLVNMRSIYFFRVALVIVICPPLCKGSWHGAAVTGGLYVFKRIPCLPQFVNPSVKNQRFLTAPFTQGSQGAPAPVHFSMVPVKTGDVSSGSSSCLPRSGKLRERIVTRESLEGATPATASTSRAKPPEGKSLRGQTFSLSESP